MQVPGGCHGNIWGICEGDDFVPSPINGKVTLFVNDFLFKEANIHEATELESLFALE